MCLDVCRGSGAGRVSGLDGGFWGGGAAWTCRVGGAGGGGVFRGRDEEVARGLEEVEPKGADEVAVVVTADVLRAEGEAQGEIETGGEIQDESAGDAEGGHAGGKGDVAHVERQAEKFSEDRGHAEHKTEDDRAAPAGNVSRKSVRDARQSFGLEFFAEAMFGD